MSIVGILFMKAGGLCASGESHLCQKIRKTIANVDLWRYAPEERKKKIDTVCS